MDEEKTVSAKWIEFDNSFVNTDSISVIWKKEDEKDILKESSLEIKRKYIEYYIYISTTDAEMFEEFKTIEERDIRFEELKQLIGIHKQPQHT